MINSSRSSAARRGSLGSGHAKPLAESTQVDRFGGLEVAGYPKRAVSGDEAAAKAVKMRTLTNLHNAQPLWLSDLHDALDTTVAAAYGCPANISDDDVLRELLVLNGPRNHRWQGKKT